VQVVEKFVTDIPQQDICVLSYYVSQVCFTKEHLQQVNRYYS